MAAMHVKELSAEETHLATEALRELRPHLGDGIAEQANRQRERGYRIAAAFTDGDDQALAVAGFRISESLSWGRHVYVDDLVTRAEARGQGGAAAVMTFVEEIGRREGCGQLHLDSGVEPKRFDAHRFYLRRGMGIYAHHFARGL